MPKKLADRVRGASGVGGAVDDRAVDGRRGDSGSSPRKKRGRARRGRAPIGSDREGAAPDGAELYGALEAGGPPAVDEDGATVFRDEEGRLWAVDPLTGVKYRKLWRDAAWLAKMGTRARKKEKVEFTLRDMESHLESEDDDDFRGITGEDLEESASRFLGPLRVELSRRELIRLRKERARAERESARALVEEYAELDREFGSDGVTNGL